MSAGYADPGDVLRLPRAQPDVSPAEKIGEDTRAEVFAAILTAGPLSRTEVARRTGLSPSTVTKVVTPLLAADYLVEAGAESSGIGRPRRLLRVNRNRHTVIGVKLGTTHVTGVRTDMEARVNARAARPLAERSPTHSLEAAAAVVGELLAAEPAASAKALGVGVGVSGHIDARSGVCLRSGLLGWEQVDIAGPLSALTGLPVVVDNDVNTLTVAEHLFGAGRGARSFAVVTVGVGVGCGLLLDGELYSGATGMAGELGHIPVDPAGPQCHCGNRGCLESLASFDAIMRETRGSGGTACSSIEQAIALARTDRGPAGQAARDAFETAGAALGRGLATLCNLLNLEKIVLSGEGAVAHDLFGRALDAALRAHAFSTAARDCDLVVDAVDDDLWARGAACHVIREAVGASPP